MNFYLTQVMSGRAAFNTYLFRMKLVESPECINCDRRGRDDDAWRTLFECTAFQLYWEDTMTTLQKMGGQFGTDHAEKRRWMGHFDNVPQDGDVQEWQRQL